MSYHRQKKNLFNQEELGEAAKQTRNKKSRAKQRKNVKRKLERKKKADQLNVCMQIVHYLYIHVSFLEKDKLTLENQPKTNNSHRQSIYWFNSFSSHQLINQRSYVLNTHQRILINPMRTWPHSIRSWPI